MKIDVEPRALNNPDNEKDIRKIIEDKAIEFTEDAFDGVEVAWQAEKGANSEDERGVDAGIRIANHLVAPDFTTGGLTTVSEKIKRMARKPFVFIKNENGQDEEALKIVIRLELDDWQEYCKQADDAELRVAEYLPHNSTAREKEKIINQMIAQINVFSENFKNDKKRITMLEDIKKELEEEWLD